MGAKPISINIGINFSTWAVPTSLEFRYDRGTYTFTLEGPHYKSEVERRFDPNDTAELRSLFGDEITDRMLVALREYRTLPPIGEDILW